MSAPTMSMMDHEHMSKKIYLWNVQNGKFIDDFHNNKCKRRRNGNYVGRIAKDRKVYDKILFHGEKTMLNGPRVVDSLRFKFENIMFFHYEHDADCNFEVYGNQVRRFGKNYELVDSEYPFQHLDKKENLTTLDLQILKKHFENMLDMLNYCIEENSKIVVFGHYVTRLKAQRRHLLRYYNKYLP